MTSVSIVIEMELKCLQMFNSLVNFLHKVKLSIIFLLILVVHCDGEKWLCPVSTNNSQSFRHFICKDGTESDLEGCCSHSSYLDLIRTKSSEVTDVKISKCDAIYVMGCAKNYNNLSSLDISQSQYAILNFFQINHTLLRKINASNNVLKGIPLRFFAEIPEIVEVDFSHNNLTNIERTTFEGAKKLTRINLAYNQISGIHKESFGNFSNLEYLDLRGNNMKVVLDYTKLTTLKELHLEGNKYSYTPRVPPTASLYISWKEFSFINLRFLGGKYRIVLDDQIEGFIRRENYTEIHCTEQIFEEITSFIATTNQIENVHDLLRCLGPLLDWLELPGNFIGEVNSTTFSRFPILTQLILRHTQLKSFDFTNLKYQKTLNILDISGNDLKMVEKTQFLSHFEELRHFGVADNHLENIPEIVHSLSPTIEWLHLSGNFIGDLSRIPFEKFAELRTLEMRNTSLQINDVNPFDRNAKMKFLDISNNNMSALNFAILSSTLTHLEAFFAAGCNIQNSVNVIKLFGKTLYQIDLSNNFVGEVDATTFSHMELHILNMANTSLTKFEISENLTKLNTLNISHNHVKSIHFRFLMKNLQIIDVHDNDFFELDNLTLSNIPKLNTLDISKNNFPCKYLAKLDTQIKHDWPHMKIIGDSNDHKHGEDCHSFNGNNLSSPIFFYSLIISIPIAIVFIAGLSFAIHRCFFMKTSTSNYENVVLPQREGTEMLPVSGGDGEGEEPIYEEIGPSTIEYTYDNLRFGFNPMPISTDNHYDNAGLVKMEVES